MLKAFVTGGMGFIGSNLVDRLIANGASVVVYDNGSTGRAEFLQLARASGQCELINGDLLDAPNLKRSMAGAEIVFHLAANADVRYGPLHPERDLQQNTVGTFNVLEAMRANEVPTILFSSTGSVYGEPREFPTPEDAPFPLQTSLYGASKLAGEGLLSAYAEAFGIRTIICRFVSILGQRYTHGHVFDFLRQIRADPHRLKVLGNGMQRKSYLHVDDCLDAMFLTLRATPTPHAEVYNLGTDHFCTVQDSIGWICEELVVHPTIQYSGGERGWVGDSPFIFLDCSKMRALGWSPRYRIAEGVRATVRFLLKNPHLLETQ